MALNRVHFLEGSHVDIAEPANFALWLSNFAACHAIRGRLNPALLLTLGCKLSFDA